MSSGIEPAHAWIYRRKRRLRGGELRSYRVEDHAHRLYRARFCAAVALPDAFVSAPRISAADHLAMLALYIDAGIGTTVNIPPDYLFADFKHLYLDAWRRGVKGLSTFRPSLGRHGVLSLDGAAEPAEAPCRAFGRWDGAKTCYGAELLYS